ncbi:hypothetical protein Poly41_05420 [Novipirellula artificiosorum]|uniref:Uncharacterized protein n=1 Tax=Novipirellula artificiosorum TaxID=2528016 RepID=A0A5C6E488_9BACT|nr:hypothetical protein Poly41_05420 [Novipirellula artificiosorum]
MIESSTATLAVHWPCSIDLLFWPRQVDLGSVLDQQDIVDLIDSLIRCLDVWLKDLFRSDVVVVEKAIAALDISLTLEGCRNAHIGTVAEDIGHLLDSFREPLVPELTAIEFSRKMSNR